VLASQIVTAVTGLAGSIIAARVLGPTGRGVLALVMLWISLFALAVPLSSGYGLVYEIRRSRVSLSQALSSAIGLAALFGGAAVGLAVLAARGCWFGALDGVPLGYVLVGAIALPAMIFNRLSSLALTGCGRVRQASVISAAGSLFSLALLSAFLLVLRLDVWGAILAASLSSCSGTVITVVWLRSHLRRDSVLRPALWASSIRFGSKLHVGTLAQWLNYSLDRFLLNAFLGPGAVGVYAVAATLGERLWMLPGAVGASLFCRTGGDLTNDADVTARACRNTFWLMCGACAAVAILAPVLIPVVFGHDFAAASWVLLLLLPGVLMLTLGKVIAPYVCNRGRPAAATCISVGALGLTVALNLLLIPLLGIAGAAVASSISYSANGIAFAVVFLRMSELPPRQLVGLPEVDVRRLGARCTKWLSTTIAGVCYDGPA
jgi:O-antigen/teichoic acid export membrane protein